MDGRDLTFDDIGLRAGSTWADVGGRQARQGAGNAIECMPQDTPYDQALTVAKKVSQKIGTPGCGWVGFRFTALERHATSRTFWPISDR
jgi:hypothetical protein